MAPNATPGAPASAPAAIASVSALANVEPFGDKRGEAFAVFLDRLMEVLQQLAPEADPEQREEFQIRIREYRAALHDPRRRHELPQVTDACILLCRTYLEGSRTYHAEREKELTEVITILRDAAKLSVGDSSEFNSQIIESSERITRIVQLDDIRELRKRVSEEVASLRLAVAEKQQRDEQAYARLTSRVEALQQKLSEMETEATVDPLTKVGNRRRFDSALRRLVNKAGESGQSLALAMVDVDHFKKINDTHGHPIGDRVLLCVAQWLAKGVRQTDVVCRYGGEEFAILLPGASSTEVEGRLKKLLMDIANSSYEYDVLGRKEKVHFTVSCGLVDLEAGESEDMFLKRADDALYEAKKKGRNRVVARKRGLLGRVTRLGMMPDGAERREPGKKARAGAPWRHSGPSCFGTIEPLLLVGGRFVERLDPIRLHRAVRVCEVPVVGLHLRAVRRFDGDRLNLTRLEESIDHATTTGDNGARAVVPGFGD
ncbi:MAG: GGDEF domain-containing protein [Vicinamibacterales bacterium]